MKNFQELNAILRSLEEKTTHIRLDTSLPMVIRIDGHGFSKFTKGFTKPNDPRIARAMQCTAFDLMKHFNARLALTFSDEVSVILPPLQDAQWKEVAKAARGQAVTPQYMYGGRLSKITTLASGLASARFNHYLSCASFPTGDAHLRAEKLGSAFFDARAFNLPDRGHVLDYLRVRVADCERNSQLNIARSRMSARECHCVGNARLLQILEERHGLSYGDLPAWYRCGVVLKKRCVRKDAVDGRTGAPVAVARSQPAVADADRFLRAATGDDVMAKFVNVPDGEREISVENIRESPLSALFEEFELPASSFE